MSTLFQRRCANHAGREAVARCLECTRDFCRECVTEHDDRLICSTCLRKLAPATAGRKVSFAGIVRAGQCVAGVFLCLMFFYFLGRTLLRLPSSFHEGTLWQSADEP